MNLSTVAAGCIRNLEQVRKKNVVHIVLVNLCSEFDADGELEELNVVNNVGPNDVEIFEQLPLTNEPKTENNDDEIHIFSLHVQFAPTTTELWSTCIDSGAQKTVLGMKPAKAYIRQTDSRLELTKIPGDKRTSFRFGKANHASQGTLHVRMPIGDDIVVTYDV